MFNKRRDEKITCLRNTEFLYDKFDTYFKEGKKEYRFKVPCSKPIEYPNIQNLTIDPYLLGYWLGDGTIGTPYLTVGLQDKEALIQILEERGHLLNVRQSSNRDDIYTIGVDMYKDLIDEKKSKQSALKGSFKNKLDNLKILNNKRIPERYLYGTVQQRLDLLSGLMDSDGACNSDGSCEISQSKEHKELIEDIGKLLNSLGITYSLKPKKATCNNKEFEAYRIYFRITEDLGCFKLRRKFNRMPKKQTLHIKTKAIVNIKKINKKIPMRCITVSNDSGTFLCGNKGTVTHNSFLTAPYIMTRSMLIPNHETYIMSVTGPQAQETFKKMESLAMGKIASIVGTNHIFLNEVVKQNAKDSGFTHDKNSYSVELYNGSKVRTLNSVPKNVVGIRSHLNVYDEAGKIPKEFFDLTRPFTTQNTNFVTGANFNQKCLPKQFPTQILYCSSAEDIFTELWQAYKMGAEEMIMGNPEYFVCDISCEFSFAPTMNGKPYAPLLERSVVDQALAQNAFRANREYYNKFDTTGGQDNVVSAVKLQRCSRAYLPEFEYQEGKRYIIVNDPSSKIDNSFVLVAELFEDEEKGLMCRIVNGHNLVEHRKDGSKKVIQKPQQIEILKNYISTYNGPANDYDNLERVIIDAGAGGGGFDMYQFILPGWTETINGVRIKHVGIIDMEDKYCQEERDKFPEAKDILTLANFKRDKVDMYEATMDALNQELIIFPKDSNGRGEMEFEETDAEGKVTYRYERLNKEELRAVVEIELLKYEIMAMEKTKNTATGRISFDLMPSKKSEGLHDDRADCLAMLSYYLMQLRAKNRMKQFNKAKPDYEKLMQGKKEITQGRFGGANPFANRGLNPFLNS